MSPLGAVLITLALVLVIVGAAVLFMAIGAPGKMDDPD
jgi:hypothetical protein